MGMMGCCTGGFDEGRQHDDEIAGLFENYPETDEAAPVHDGPLHGHAAAVHVVQMTAAPQRQAGVIDLQPPHWK